MSIHAVCKKEDDTKEHMLQCGRDEVASKMIFKVEEWGEVDSAAI